jgi:hypothetical protein
MKKFLPFITLAICTLAACDNKAENKTPIATPPNATKTAPPIAPGTPMPPGHPDIGGTTSQAATLSGMTDIEQPTESVQTQQGTVISSIDIPQFTYLEVKQDGKIRWIAAATLAVKKGDIIDFDEGSTMHNFTSKTLNRTFPSITFVNNASVGNKK